MRGIVRHAVCDFVLARKDGQSSDGRRPDSVEPGTLLDDLARRDFTINGLFFDPIAEQVIDYVGGQDDLQAGIIRAIGQPRDRIAEDKLRMLRATTGPTSATSSSCSRLASISRSMLPKWRARSRAVARSPAL